MVGVAVERRAADVLRDVLAELRMELEVLVAAQERLQVLLLRQPFDQRLVDLQIALAGTRRKPSAVEIRDGGISMIRVTDNGEGIDRSQIREVSVIEFMYFRFRRQVL